jgi:hypothetical protein
MSYNQRDVQITTSSNCEAEALMSLLIQSDAVSPFRYVRKKLNLGSEKQYSYLF